MFNATSHVQRGKSVSVATNGPFWQIDLLPFCLTVSYGKLILPSRTSSILDRILQVKSPL